MPKYSDLIKELTDLKEDKPSIFKHINPESASRMRLQNRFPTGLDIARYTAEIMRRDMADYDKDSSNYTQSLGCWHGFTAQQMMMEMQARVAERESQLIAEFVAEYEELLKESAADPLIDLKRDELKVREQDMIRKGKEANQKLGLEKKKLDTNTKVDREKIDQQKDAVAIRSAIAAEKLEKDSIYRLLSPLLNIFFGIPNTKQFKIDIHSRMKDHNFDNLEKIFLDFVEKKKILIN